MLCAVLSPLILNLKVFCDNLFVQDDKLNALPNELKNTLLKFYFQKPKLDILFLIVHRLIYQAMPQLLFLVFQYYQ